MYTIWRVMFCSRVAGVVFGLVLVLVFFFVCWLFSFLVVVPLFFWVGFAGWLSSVLFCFALLWFRFVWPALFVGALALCPCFGWLGPCPSFNNIS